MHPFLASIKHLCNDINNAAENINDGGCCVFAAKLGEQLSKFGKVSIRVIGYENEWGRNINDIREVVNDNFDVTEWQSNGVSFWHVFIEFKYKRTLYQIDSTGVYNVNRGQTLVPKHNALLDGCFTIDEAKQFASTPKGWNRCFDRNKIPLIEFMMDKFFEDCAKV